MRAIIICLMLTLCGCVASVRGASTVTYKQEGFSVGLLQQSGVSIMPVVAGHGVEGYRRPFADALQTTLTTHAPKGTKVIGWQETGQKLNDGGLVEAYNGLVASYASTALLDKKVLLKLKEATGSRFFLVTVLGDFKQTQSTTYDPTLDPSVGQNVQTQVNLQAKAYIWDAEKGDVVWEAMGGASATANSKAFQTIETYDPLVYGQRASEAIIGSLLGKDLAPPESSSVQ